MVSTTLLTASFLLVGICYALAAVECSVLKREERFLMGGHGSWITTAHLLAAVSFGFAAIAEMSGMSSQDAPVFWALMIGCYSGLVALLLRRWS